MKTSQRPILVVGCGSIGRRHLQNLKSLGWNNLIAFDANESRLHEASSQLDAIPVSTLEEGLERSPLAVLVCVPSYLHVSIAKKAIEAGCHLLVEKPVSHQLEGVAGLARELDARGLVGIVGFNLRFHPGLRKTKQLLSQGAIGRLLSCRLNAGQYLPDWHPWEDYRKGYSANRTMGGGILLDTHEFEYLGWLVGRPKELSCFSDKVSDLDIDTEDVAEVNFWFESGAIGNLHVDYLQRSYQRRYEFYGESGTLVWDYSNGVELFDAQTRKWMDFEEGRNVDPNESYLKEMRHFLACMEGREKPEVDFHRGIEVLEWTIAAKESAQTGKKIVLSRRDEVRS